MLIVHVWIVNWKFLALLRRRNNLKLVSQRLVGFLINIDVVFYLCFFFFFFFWTNLQIPTRPMELWYLLMSNRNSTHIIFSAQGDLHTFMSQQSRKIDDFCLLLTTHHPSLMFAGFVVERIECIRHGRTKKQFILATVMTECVLFKFVVGDSHVYNTQQQYKNVKNFERQWTKTKSIINNNDRGREKQKSGGREIERRLGSMWESQHKTTTQKKKLNLWYFLRVEFSMAI